ncbi:glucose dehydrogenase [Gluconobacter oxydans]|uniref:Glucose dehydrogenase n=2 Tax=Gluconobacter oxydans TaxID=442 RepID=A0AB34XJT2_GLUOY|nr:membrane-bound PQQ-dependent dehydrogenase, glucose/quinate/shikimate family [Gluconobacter oxydans]AHK72212.1 quinoprotein glucose dehydrogenase Gcd [Gluconobacter oxydans DSM 3504]KXV10475.1 glucose dehydrogenase [Gluconobacter oxydans]
MSNDIHIGSRPWAISGLIFIVSLTLIIGGIELIALGGTFYYLIAGFALAASAALAWTRRSLALWVVAVTIFGTLVWSLAEVHLTFWELEPRLVAFIVLGLLVLLPWFRGRLFPVSRAATLTVGGVTAVTFLTLIVAALQPNGISGAAHLASGSDGGSDTSVPDQDWQYYGRTQGQDRFSPLKQINAGNVKNLKLAWSMHTGDTMRAGEDQGGTDGGHEFNFENTPIKVNDTLYVCTGHSWVEAIDAATGKIKWKYDPKANTGPDVYLACRGVAYYKAAEGASAECPERIIAPVLDARMMALNARTGKPCEDFGEHGFISLTQYLGHVPDGFHFVTSPPMIISDRVITGGWIFDNQATFEPSGAVRAFDPITGKIVWAWDVGHNPQTWTPGPNDELTRDTPNAWGVYTADPKLGLVYLPTGNAPPDYFGGHRRPFDDKFSSSIIALDAKTGELRWHFQTVHHDVWDMDVPVGPSLIDLPGPDGSTIPALVQTTKRGEFFMLNRETGEPVAEVAEKKTPQGAVPGDWTTPTQPYSVGLPSVSPKDLTEKHLWGATPIDQMMCRIQFRKAAYQGQFTPPQLKETIVYPAFDGVVDWNGASVDPVNKLVISTANYIPFMLRMAPRDAVEKAGFVPPWDGSGNEPHVKGGVYGPQYGTPYVGYVHPWLNPLMVPCDAPPWGTLTAIDLVSRKIVWQHPIGTTRDTGPFGTHNNLPLPTGMFNIGGTMVTGGGLVFLGATADDYLRAVDESTGKVVWRARLPAGGQANPMSYMINGKQYIVIAAGGHAGMGTRTGDYILAYALDDGQTAQAN